MVSLRFKVGGVVRYVGDVEFDGHGTEVVVIGVDPYDSHGLVYLVIPVWDGLEHHSEWVEDGNLEELDDGE